MSTRRLVAETRDDGALHVVSLPLVGWEIYDEPKPRPSLQEMSDEIRLMLADAGIGEPPLISFDPDGKVRVAWVEDIQRILEPFMVALGPEIRRARRLRRSLAKARQRKPPTRKHGDDRPEMLELVQQSGGRWLPVSPSEGIGHGVYSIPGSVLSAIRRHADEVHLARPGYESLGALILSDDGRSIVRYARLHNPSRSPGHANIASGRLERRPDGLPVICCHSHPESEAKPSKRDSATAHRYGWQMFAIVGADGLRLWAPDGDGGCREIPFEIVS